MCCDNITDVAVEAVAKGCEQLTSLHLTNCYDITDAAVKAVAEGCKQLTLLSLHGCNNISTEARSRTIVSGPKSQHKSGL